jgi:hypothetical protein
LSVAWLAEFVEMRDERMGMRAKLISETLEFVGRAALSQRAGVELVRRWCERRGVRIATFAAR